MMMALQLSSLLSQSRQLDGRAAFAWDTAVPGVNNSCHDGTDPQIHGWDADAADGSLVFASSRAPSPANTIHASTIMASVLFHPSFSGWAAGRLAGSSRGVSLLPACLSAFFSYPPPSYSHCGLKRCWARLVLLSSLAAGNSSSLHTLARRAQVEALFIPDF